MNLKQFNERTLGVTEAVILGMAICGFILQQTITNPTSPLTLGLWVVLLLMLGYVMKYSVNGLLDFIHDIRENRQ